MEWGRTRRLDALEVATGAVCGRTGGALFVIDGAVALRNAIGQGSHSGVRRQTKRVTRW